MRHLSVHSPRHSLIPGVLASLNPTRTPPDRRHCDTIPILARLYCTPSARCTPHAAHCPAQPTCLLTTSAAVAIVSAACTSRALVSSRSRCARPRSTSVRIRCAVPGSHAASLTLQPNGSLRVCWAANTNLVKPRRRPRAAPPSPWLRLRCHDTRRHSRSQPAWAHPSTSVASNLRLRTLNCSPTPTSPSPCEGPTLYCPRQRLQLHAPCRSKHTQLAAAVPCPIRGKSLLALCPPSPSILRALQSPRPNRRRPNCLRPCLQHQQNQPMDTGVAAAS